MNKYPIYIISKGRYTNPLTAKALQNLGVRFMVVVEPQEEKLYADVIGSQNVLVLPFSNLGEGSIPARNWVWEHSLTTGARRHWILDDNIRAFYRLHQNWKGYLADGVCFRAIEDWSDRYTNVRLAGMQYEFLTPRIQKHPPIIFNTRIYSCILIDNSLGIRWRGRYNEDTDLSLRVLKDGDCTALFCAFVADKAATMTMAGGNTDELYKQNAEFDGRLEMAKSLVKQHPDVVTVRYKWGRWQHHVDYRPFKKNKLIRRTDIDWSAIEGTTNNYGMKLVKA